MARQGGGNFTRTIIDIPANGTLLAILALGPAVFVEVEESQLKANGTQNIPQGFEYKLPNDGFGQLFETIPGDKLEIGDRRAHYAGTGGGSILGNGPSYIIGIGATAATTLFSAQALTANPTSIQVTQWFS